MKFDDAFKNLAALDTANEIAAFLNRENVKGIRRESDQCPITQYLSCAEDVIEVSTTHEHVWYYRFVDPYSPENRNCRRSMTEAMSKFTIQFDDGGYPTLELSE